MSSRWQVNTFYTYFEKHRFYFVDDEGRETAGFGRFQTAEEALEAGKKFLEEEIIADRYFIEVYQKSPRNPALGYTYTIYNLWHDPVYDSYPTSFRTPEIAKVAGVERAKKRAMAVV